MLNDTTTIAKDLFTVWLYEDGDPYNAVLNYEVVGTNGEKLACGHQRPADSGGG
ncbi:MULTISPECIES: hypothetical protein [unclassified Streptomyces]|uniref:hypothetical protein n=1 Tax=unclassified Streptomyces TaxID=2593676 RepID=UPI002255D441|nr:MULTISPECIES: hypothetical protein [unclassified Streptomyces]MCX4402448.1 hypothetical protein [Streptomyces sp. NBC_01764]MCX5182704.1 hypothetical protein [Streptomyces sp. NBC_00268]